jgi:hypothetical protein
MTGICTSITVQRSIRKRLIFQKALILNELNIEISGIYLALT